MAYHIILAVSVSVCPETSEVKPAVRLRRRPKVATGPGNYTLCLSHVILSAITVDMYDTLVSLVPTVEFLTPFTPAQPHGLSVLLKLRDQRIALLHHIRVLLVLVVRPIRLDDPVDSINRACDAVAGNELGQVPVTVSRKV